MPHGLKRFQKAEALHFITFSCFDRLPFLDAPDPKNTVEAVLELTRARHQARVYAYVLMPEHVHLLVNEPRLRTLATAVQVLKQKTSRQLKIAGEPQFWQRRYYDFVVPCEAKRVEKLRYIHRNPVKRGLAADPSGWRWSSFGHYATGSVSTVEIESEWTARKREQQVRLSTSER